MQPQGRISEAVLFSSCNGLNDSKVMSELFYDENGKTDLLSCFNVTTTGNGKLVKVPDFELVDSADDNILCLTAKDYAYAQTGSTLYSFDGNSLTQFNSNPVFNNLKANYIHTPLDTRMSVEGATHKVLNGALATSACAVGAYSGPTNSKVISAMPDFETGFMFGSRLMTSYGRFFQYSEPYYYDRFNLADNYIPHMSDILQSGYVPGCVIATHIDGVTTYVGNAVNNLQKRFYPCEVIDGTLYSGFISKIYGYGHVFLCNDGVYVVEESGKLTNITVSNTSYVDRLNDQYFGVTLQDGKYLAYGDEFCVEYDFVAKCYLVRSNDDITSCCVFKNTAYLVSGTSIYTLSPDDNDNSAECVVQLPYNNFGTDEDKQIRFLYFTGTIDGDAHFIVHNQNGDSVTKDVSNLGYVENYKIDSLRTVRGNKLSVEIISHGEYFKLDELRAAYYRCSRRN